MYNKGNTIIPGKIHQWKLDKQELDVRGKTNNITAADESSPREDNAIWGETRGRAPQKAPEPKEAPSKDEKVGQEEERIIWLDYMCGGAWQVWSTPQIRGGGTEKQTRELMSLVGDGQPLVW